MKKFVLWLIRVFKLDIPAEKIVEKKVEKIVERQVLPADGVITGDLYITGQVILINGSLVMGEGLTCYAESEPSGEGVFIEEPAVREFWVQKFDGEKEVKNGSI